MLFVLLATRLFTKHITSKRFIIIIIIIIISIIIIIIITGVLISP